MKTYDYIDSNVIIEVLTEAEYQNLCKGYLYSLVRYGTSIGFVSLLALGEITNFVLKNVVQEKRSLAFYKVSESLEPLDLKGFNDQTFRIALELMELDYKLMNEPADALHLATAISNNANRFITLEDKKFNPTLRDFLKQRGLKVISLISKIKP